RTPRRQDRCNPLGAPRNAHVGLGVGDPKCSDRQLWRACPGPNPKVRPPTRAAQPDLAERGMSFRSRLRNLLEALDVVLGRRPDEVVLKATLSGKGLVEDRALRGRRITRVLGPRIPRGG